MAGSVTMRLPQIDDLYEHYKGGRYKITGYGFSTETGRPTIHYVSVQDGSTTWVRDLGEFLGFTPDHNPRFQHRP